MGYESDSDVLVLGGGYAGVMAARNAAGGATGARVTLVSGTDHFVDRIRLHQAATGQVLPERSMRALLTPLGVDFCHATVVRIEPAARRVWVRDAGGGTERSIAFGHLLYALGSRQDLGAVEGAAEFARGLDGAGAEGLAARAGELRDLAARDGRALVVGGGLTGIELAAELAESLPGLRVTIASDGAVGAGLSDAGRAHLARAFARLGVRVREGARVVAFARGEARLEGGGVEGFDACFWAGPFGVSPLGREAGLAVDARGRIRVDAQLRSVSHPHVYAAGDAAGAISPSGDVLRMACATAMPLGAHAGRNVARDLRGEEPVPFGFSYVLQCVSLGRRDGLVQPLNALGAPRPRVYTGRLAAWVKEGICRGVQFALRTGAYAWSGRGGAATRRASLAKGRAA